MTVRKVLHTAFAVASLALGATTANAAGMISGSVSIIGFYAAPFPAGGTSIVSQLTSVAQGAALAGAGFVDYATSGGVVATQTILLDTLAPGYPECSRSMPSRPTAPSSTLFWPGGGP